MHDEAIQTFWPFSPLMTTDRIQMRHRAADGVPQHPDPRGAELLITEIYHQVSDYCFSVSKKSV